MVVLAVSLSTVQAISQYRIKLPGNLKPQQERDGVARAIGEVLKRSPDGPPLLDPIKNLGINDKSFKDLVKVSLVGRLNSSRAALVTKSQAHRNIISKSLYSKTRLRLYP